MALELAGVVLDKLVSIEATETARFVRHAVPGLSGEYVQDLGRPAVRIRIRGIFYGDKAADDLKTLRGHLLDRTPIDFVCELTGQGYFAQVVVDDLEVAQRAGQIDEFDFACMVTEYVPPPPPPAANPLADLDGGILGEAASLMDDMQNALSQVAGLADLLSGAADFGNPTTRLPKMLDSFTKAASGASGTISGIGALL
jgi:hypothetical protein